MYVGRQTDKHDEAYRGFATFRHENAKTTFKNSSSYWGRSGYIKTQDRSRFPINTGAKHLHVSTILQGVTRHLTQSEHSSSWHPNLNTHLHDIHISALTAMITQTWTLTAITSKPEHSPPLHPNMNTHLHDIQTWTLIFTTSKSQHSLPLHPNLNTHGHDAQTWTLTVTTRKSHTCLSPCSILAHNQLSTLPRGAFSNLRHLREL